MNFKNLFSFNTSKPKQTSMSRSLNVTSSGSIEEIKIQTPTQTNNQHSNEEIIPKDRFIKHEEYSDRTWRYFIDILKETDSMLLTSFLHKYFLVIQMNIFEITDILLLNIQGKLLKRNETLFKQGIDLLLRELNNLRVIDMCKKQYNNIQLIIKELGIGSINEEIIRTINDIINCVKFDLVDLEIEDEKKTKHCYRLDTYKTSNIFTSQEMNDTEKKQLREENKQVKEESQLIKLENTQLQQENEILSNHLINLNSEIRSKSNTIQQLQKNIDEIENKYLQIQYNDSLKYNEIQQKLNKIESQCTYFKTRYSYLFKDIRMKMITSNLAEGIFYKSSSYEGKYIDIFKVNPTILKSSSFTIPFITFHESIATFSITNKEISMTRLLSERKILFENSVWYFEDEKFDLLIQLNEEIMTEVLPLQVSLKEVLFGEQKQIEIINNDNQRENVLTITIPQSVENEEIVYDETIGYYIKYLYEKDENYYRNGYDLHLTIRIDENEIEKMRVLTYIDEMKQWEMKLIPGQWIVENYGFYNKEKDIRGDFIVTIVCN